VSSSWGKNKSFTMQATAKFQQNLQSLVRQASQAILTLYNTKYRSIQNTNKARNACPRILCDTVTSAKVLVRATGKSRLLTFARRENAGMIIEMNLRFQSLLLVLLPFSLGQVTSGSQCKLCRGGGSLVNPDITIPYGEVNLTCGLIDSGLAMFTSSDSNCTLAQSNIAPLCGCSTQNFSTSNSTKCPGFCSNMAYSNRSLPPIGGFSLTCSLANGLVQSYPANDPICLQSAVLAGQYCGCPDAVRSCTPCYSNAVPTNFSKTFSLGGETVSCGDFALATVIETIDNTTGKVNQTLCNAFQGAASLVCGCPRPPTYCSLCTSSQKLNLSATFKSPYTDQDTSCVDGEVAMNFETSDCAAILHLSNYTGIQKQCCVKSASSRFLFSFGSAASAVLFSAFAFVFM
jgi:hypothetical protein